MRPEDGRILFFALLVVAVALPAFGPVTPAVADEEPTVLVRDAWSRPTPPGVRVGAVYMTLEARGQPDRLLAIESPLAQRVELHEMLEEAGVMRMRPVGPLEIVPGDPVVLAPGGLHMMLLGLQSPLAAGARHTITLVFEHRGRKTIDVEIRGQ